MIPDLLMSSVADTMGAPGKRAPLGPILFILLQFLEK